MTIFVSPAAGTRIEPTDSYIFQRGSEATIKIIFTSNSKPTKVDTATTPLIRVRQPAFINNVVAGVPVSPDNIITTIPGTLVAGQDYEYEFKWSIPANIVPADEYSVTYEATIGAMNFEYGSELFSISASPGVVGVARSFYATIDDVRAKKLNIDDYFPKHLAKDKTARDKLIQVHIKDATEKLQEELNLHRSRSFSVNYRLFTVYYTVWSILLSSRGEDGSAVSDQNLAFWKAEWEAILRQEKKTKRNTKYTYG